MMKQIKGSFSTKMTAQPPYDAEAGLTLARMSVDKVFEGPLSGTGKVEMLAASTSMKGSAGYVAIERVHASLEGKTGDFILQHSGTMDRGVASLTVRVVADSGTEGLVGICGRMAIDIVEGKHFYTFDYSLPSDGVPTSAKEPNDLARLFIERGNADDVDGLVALYETSARVIKRDGSEAVGHAAIREMYTKILAMKPHFELGKQHPAVINGDIALTATVLPGGSATAEVARRQSDGTWLWILDRPRVTA